MALFWQGWTPEADARAAIAILHGYGEHSGRYCRFAAHFAARGFAVYACDLRGHGRSPGQRGHIARFSEYLQDAAALVAHVRALEPRAAAYLLGHSMGGLIAARYTEQASVHLPGLILSSPFLGLKMPVPGWKRAAANILSWIAPSFPMSSDVPLVWISHDGAIVEATRRDPLSHRKGTPRWFTETLTSQKLAIEQADSIAAPVLLLYAGDDRLADSRAGERFYARLTGPKTEHCYAGYYHEIFNERGYERVFADLEGWLDERLADRELEGGGSDDR